MSQPTYQTVKLARGRHLTPEAGVCVMELSSMLAGEAFSDHPRSVSPVIAGFLRAYNDLIDDRRRQDLYACAAEVIGTAGSREAEMARAARLQEWGEQLRTQRWWRRLLPGRLGTARRQASLQPHLAGPYAVHSIFRLTDDVHRSVLELVSELAAVKAPVPEGARTPSGGLSNAGFASQAVDLARAILSQGDVPLPSAEGGE